MIRSLLLTLLMALLACSPKADEAQKRERVRENNRGVALMGSFEYKQATAVFAALLKQAPDWHDLRVNLGIATLNLQEPGCEDQALALFQEVLAHEPKHVQALYCSGLLQLYKGDNARALALFQAAGEQLPSDPFIHYYIGQSQLQLGELSVALSAFSQAAKLDPYLRSAYYGAFMTLQRLGRTEEARAQIALFEQLNNNPRARQVEFKYTRMGSLAEARVLVPPGLAPLPPPKGELFAPPAALPLPPGAQWAKPTSLTSADLDGDGQPDLFASGAWSIDGQLRNAVYLSGVTSLRHDLDHPLASIPGVQAAAWGDVDNDGLLDVYLSCSSGSGFRSYAGGAWRPLPSPPDRPKGTRDATLVDADHDGDLDLFVIYLDGSCELWNNNLDGTWKALSGELRLSAKHARQALFADLDNDRDLDLILLREQQPHLVLQNDLLWNYGPMTSLASLTTKPLDGLLAVDIEADGQIELVAHHPDGKLSLWFRKGNAWNNRDLGLNGGPDMDWLDLDGSGRFHLVCRDAEGLRLHDLAQGEKRLAKAVPGMGPWAPLLLEVAKGPSLLAVAKDGSIQYAKPGPGRWPFLALNFSGAQSEGGTTRSNKSAIGTRFAVRTADRWAASQTGRISTRAGQSLAPLAIGLGGEAALDYVALTWPDGVYQTELALASGKRHTITETQRQIASCPVLFAWDGKGFRFVSDLLGVGGIGFNLARGVYGEPRPWERFLLDDALVVPESNQVRLKIAEPMEEASYLDHVQLFAYDLPPGWQMVLDERMATGAPEPSGLPVFFREEQLPQRVRNDRGQDVTASVAQVDQQAAPTPPLDRRFLGLLREEHRLDLEFAEKLDTRKGEPYLVIDGWLEYPYSQTCFAAWQAGIAYQSLSLDVPDGKAWKTVLPEFGYPAGMPRRMSVALPAAVQGMRSLRLRTNQEIYIDRVSIVYRRPDAECEAKRATLALSRGDLRAEGFATRTTGPQALPQFDDGRRTPLWDTRHQSGFYSQLGDVTPLLARRDDALAIFGPGEAISLTFGPLPPATRGHRRVWVFEIRGWCKDMDLYTRDGNTLAPIPASAPLTAAAAELQARHNTRYQAGY